MLRVPVALQKKAKFFFSTSLSNSSILLRATAKISGRLRNAAGNYRSARIALPLRRLQGRLQPPPLTFTRSGIAKVSVKSVETHNFRYHSQ
jgi:hypothetical protein